MAKTKPKNQVPMVNRSNLVVRVPKIEAPPINNVTPIDYNAPDTGKERSNRNKLTVPSEEEQQSYSTDYRFPVGKNKNGKIRIIKGAKINKAPVIYSNVHIPDSISRIPKRDKRGKVAGRTTPEFGYNDKGTPMETPAEAGVISPTMLIIAGIAILVYLFVRK
jgi:hypothetical protein